MRMSGGRFVLLLLLCGAVSLADTSAKGKGSSPTAGPPAVTGVSGVSGVADASTTPAASESSVLTTTGGVLSSSTPTEPTSTVTELTLCTELNITMSMEKISGCMGSMITFLYKQDHVLDLSGANQKQVTDLFSGGKKLTHSMLLQKSGIKTLNFSIEISRERLYDIKYNDELGKIVLNTATIMGKPVRVKIIGNKLLTQNDIKAFTDKIRDKKTADSYIQDAGECTMKDKKNLQDFEYLTGCIYFYKDLTITKDTQGTPPQKLPFSNISSGCLNIQGTSLTNLDFLINVGKEEMDIDCPATHFNEINGNGNLCLYSETKDKLMKKLGPSTKIENNMDCDDVCDSAWAQKKRNDVNIRCRKIVGDLSVTGVKDVADLEYLSEVVEIEGSLDIHHNSVNAFPFLSKLKKIKHGNTGVKTLLFIHENTSLMSLDLRSLENVTNHPDRDTVSWLVVEENSPRVLFSIEEAERLKKFGRIRADSEELKPNLTTADPETTTSNSPRAVMYLILVVILF